MKKNKIIAIFLSLILIINMTIGFWPGQVKGTEINTTQPAVEEEHQPAVEELPIIEETQSIVQEEKTVSAPEETDQQTILPQEYQDAGTVNIAQNDSKSFSVVIRDIVAHTGFNSISVPVWTENKGQDDLIWYTATRQGDGSYKADINIKDHNYETGDYNVHVYGIDSTNYSTWIYSSRFKNLDLSNTTVVGKATGGTTFDVIVDGLSYPIGIKTIQVPIWSLKNGQDDIVWYTGVKQSDGTFKVSVNTANHKNDRGSYALHVYGNDINDTSTMLTLGVYEVPEMKVGTVNIVQNDNKSFSVVIRDILAPTGLKSISVPVWTENKGQDDLIWHAAIKQGDGSYKADINIKDHNYETGDYNVHIYGIDNANYLTGIHVSGFKMLDLSNTKVLGQATGGTTFDVIVDGLSYPNGIKTIQVPIWSLNNGQDDLVWYTGIKQSDGTFKVSVNTENHKNNRGSYALHVYGVDINGTNTPLTTGVYEVPEMKAGTVNIIQNDSKSFSVVVEDIVAPTGLNSISVPVWTENKGQDDLIWYTAKRQANGSYKADINIKDHNYETGDYNVHVYGIDNTNYSTWIYSSRFKILDLSDTTVIEKAIGGTTFDVIVDGLSYPKGIKTIQVPIWSEQDGQDDLVWYTAIKQSDGTFKVSVNIGNHKNSRGVYAIHVYGIDINGNSTQLTTTSYEVPEMKGGTVNIIQNDSKSFSVVIKDITAPAGLKSISVPVWSNNKGQDDLIWHAATKQADGSYKVDINIKDHNYEIGDYTIHIYGVDDTNYSTGIYVSEFKMLDLSDVTVKTISTGGTTFDVIVDGLSYPNGIKSIQVPVWSENNGQDIVIWYTAYKQPDGSYKAEVNISNHKYDAGNYIIHVYGTDIYGERSWLGVTSSLVEVKPAAKILNVPIIQQRPELPTGCEITAVTMMLNYKGIPIDKVSLANQMPYHAWDPNKGYVGNPYLSSGWTIYPSALLNLVRNYAGSSVDLTGTDINGLEQYIWNDKPVVAWVEMHGFTVHAITITGYDSTYLYFNDPWNGYQNSRIEKMYFLSIWNKQMRRALSY